MFLGGFSFSVMAAFVKELTANGGIHSFEIVFFRSLVTLVVFGTVLAWRRQNPLVGRPKVLVVRSVTGFIALSCYFYSISVLPLSVAVIMNWCSPLFVILFSRVFLGEWIGRKAAGWAVVAIVALIAVVRPDFSMAATALPVDGVIAGLASAAFAGVAMVSIRAATASFRPEIIIFFFSAFSVVFAAPAAWAVYRAPSLVQWGQILAMGLLASLAQLAMTRAYRVGKAGRVSVVGLVNPAFSVLWGILIFAERLAPLQWAGLSVLAFAIMMVNTRR